MGGRDERADGLGANAGQCSQECYLSLTGFPEVVPVQSTGGVAGIVNPGSGHAAGGRGVTNPSAANLLTRSRTSL